MRYTPSPNRWFRLGRRPSANGIRFERVHMPMIASVLWTQTWLVVSLGMTSVFVFLFVVVLGLRVMSFFANPAIKQNQEGKGAGK